MPKPEKTMRRLLLAMLAFAVATGVNTASVEVQQRSQLLTRCFKGRDWYAHLALTTPGYLWFFSLLRGLDTRVRWPLPGALRRLGTPLALSAAALGLGALSQLGLAGTLDGYFFGRSKPNRLSKGVFRWLRNPMYDSYVLAFVATACRKQNAVHLLLAAESFVLLNLLEAGVENRPFREAAPGATNVPAALLPF